MEEGWKALTKFYSSLYSSDDEPKEGVVSVIRGNICIQKGLLCVPIQLKRGEIWQSGNAQRYI